MNEFNYVVIICLKALAISLNSFLDLKSRAVWASLIRLQITPLSSS